MGYGTVNVGYPVKKGTPNGVATLGEDGKVLSDQLPAFDTSGAAADVQKNLESHTGKKNNPHGVTAAQVGLGNVPNVKTDDQTPTHTDSSSLTALTSGEKLSVAFGKIAKAISSLISHLSNTSNPHGVTAAQAGARPSTWTPSAADVGAADQTLSNLTDKEAALENLGAMPDEMIQASGTVTSDAEFDSFILAQYNLMGDNAIRIVSCNLNYSSAVLSKGLCHLTIHNMTMSMESFCVIATANVSGVVSIYSRGYYDGDWESWKRVSNLTASDVGAAAATHKHGAGDITSGTLPIARGGTGATTAAEALTNLGAAPAYTYSTTDLTAGSSALTTGKMYLVYE